MPGWRGLGVAMIKDAGRVLVVDDEQALARLVADYLTRDGFDVPG